MFETVNTDTHISFGSDIVTDYIVGIPSGEVVNILHEDDIKRLKEANLIKFDMSKKYFIFKDANYHKIKKALQNSNYIQYVHFMMEKYNISNYKINADMTVDVEDSVDMSMKNIKKIPVKFGKINGNFDCSANKLTNLINSPDTITGYFDCSANEIYTLIGGPKIVLGGYYCMDNNLENLQGYPNICRTLFDGSRNQINTLMGLPKNIDYSFFISENRLKNLSNGPQFTKNFDCSYNQIVTLSNGIKEVDGNFTCTHNKLTDLTGMPSCNKIIYEEGNDIKELEYD